jgi:putative heme-binding domain-containing protein
LDHSLHLAAGDNLGDIQCHLTGEVVNASGCDLKIFPNTGELELVSGRTQFIRSRDDWGNWFGNDNSRPMYHYPIEERYIRRVPTLKISDNTQQMFDPPIAPPVYPISVTADRFNDLFAHNRFTSACSTIVFRSPMLGKQRNGSAFICEPVHNLIHNARIESAGSTFKATRFAGEEQKEFLASTDPWFRPVRAANGPDGMLWVVDMYRLVIEHPEWIPAAWQDQLDLRAGADRGRIYRIIPKSLAADARQRKPAAALPVLDQLSAIDLAHCFESDDGALRDLAQQTLIHRDSRLSAVPVLENMLNKSSLSRARLHALWTLDTMDAINPMLLVEAIVDVREPNVQRNALQIAERRLNDDELRELIARAMNTFEDDRLVLQSALSVGQWNTDNPEVRQACAQVLKRCLSGGREDRWLQQAVLSSATGYADSLLEVFLDKATNQPRHYAMRDLSVIADLIELDSIHHNRVVELILNALTKHNTDAASNFALIAVVLQENLVDMQHSEASPLTAEIQRCYQSACTAVSDEAQLPNHRIDAIALFGRGLGDAAAEQERLIALLAPQQPLEIQLAAAGQLNDHFDASALDAIIEHWPTFTQQVRENIVDRMLRSGARASILLDKIDAGKIASRDLTPADQQRLLQMGDQSIRVRAARLLAVEGSGDRRKIVQDYLEHLPTGGDRTQGEVYFKRLCGACHTPDENGRSAGPNLSNLTDRTAPVLLTSILDPNRAVDPQYRNYLLQTASGEIYSGAIAQEIGNTITLAQTNGKFVSLQRSEIEEIKNTGLSIMPEGLERELNHSQAADLLEYLRQPTAR